MKLRVLAGALTLLPLVIAAASTPTSTVVPGKDWDRFSSPAAAGWSADRLRAARDYSRTIGTHSVMIVQGGRVVDQWGDVARKLNVFSVRKSLLSALYGIYVGEGKIDPQQKLGTLGMPEFDSKLNDAEKQARIVDLLRARSGIYLPVDYENKQQIAARPARNSHAPGTHWWYNNWDFNAAGTIFEKKTGMLIGAAFQQRVAVPTGMQDFIPADVRYAGGEKEPHRAYLMNVSGRDMARLGLLYLRQGKWGDRQIVPADWVYKSSHTREMVQQGDSDAGGYEYFWWVAHEGVHFPVAKVPPGTFSARGAGGHYIVVIPAYDLVIVHQVENEPERWDIDSINAAGYRGVKGQDFGRLLQMILEARGAPAS
jgi:CubicO group peptidase (beta-lactamase class C family)